MEEYLEWKCEYEKRNFKSGNLYYEEIEEDGEIRLKIKTSKKQEIELSDSKKIWIEGELKSCGELWLKDEMKRRYSKIVFKLTNSVEENEYNIFNGFKADKLEVDISELTEEEKYEKIKDLLELIKLLGGDTEEGYDYLISYIANIIQLKERSLMVVMLRDKIGGVGKNTLLNFLRDEIIGRKYFVGLIESNKIYSKYNSFLMGRCMVYISNEEKIRNYSKFKKLKEMVMKSNLEIKMKKMEKIEIENNLNVIITTNREDIKINDSKLCIFECSKKRKNDIEYWKRLYKSLKDEETIRIFYEYLKNYNVKWSNLSEWEIGALSLKGI